VDPKLLIEALRSQMKRSRLSSTDVAAVAHLPRCITDVVEGCLEIEVRRRFPTMSSVHDLLEGAIEEIEAEVDEFEAAVAELEAESTELLPEPDEHLESGPRDGPDESATVDASPAPARADDDHDPAGHREEEGRWGVPLRLGLVGALLGLTLALVLNEPSPVDLSHDTVTVNTSHAITEAPSSSRSETRASGVVAATTVRSTTKEQEPAPVPTAGLVEQAKPAPIPTAGLAEQTKPAPAPVPERGPSRTSRRAGATADYTREMTRVSSRLEACLRLSGSSELTLLIRVSGGVATLRPNSPVSEGDQRCFDRVARRLDFGEATFTRTYTMRRTKL
jgi:hypothetical protein